MYIYIYTPLQVVGVDFSGRFVDAAMEIQAGKVLQYGSKKQVAKCPTEAEPSRVQFKQVCTVFPRVEPRASIPFWMAVVPGFKQGSIVNRTSFYLKLAFIMSIT